MKRSDDRVIARDQGIGVGRFFASNTPEVSPVIPTPVILRKGSLLLLTRLYTVFRILRAVLREIFDEGAYDRYLERTHAARSVESYRAFLREREAGTLPKPRCC